MNFDKLTTFPCIVPPPVPPDPRCLDSAFALQHPDLCPANSALIIKPSQVLFCNGDSIQFRVFEFAGGVETELTDGVTFESSSPEVFVIGVNSGSGTAIAEGSSNIIATYAGRTVTATLTVLPEDCCDGIEVISAIVVDNSRSMSLGFGGAYSTRLNFAKAIATSYGGLIKLVSGIPKDSVEVWSVNSTLTPLLPASQDTADILAAIAGISQTQNKTDLLTVFTTAANALLDVAADRRVLLLISDGEQTSNNDRQAILDAAFLFKQAGGVIIVVSPRASGLGYDLAERLATGGFFINAGSSTAATVLTQLNYIKNLLCAGDCVDAGDRYDNLPTLDYLLLENWEIVEGEVNLFGPGLFDVQPGHGLYLQLESSMHTVIRTIDTFDLVSGKTYRIGFKAAGNQMSLSAAQGLRVYLATAANVILFDQTFYPAWDSEFQEYNYSFTVPYDATVRLYFEQIFASDTIPGNLIDDVILRNETDLVTLLDDNFDGENMTYIAPACGMSAAVSAIADPPAPEVSLAANGGDALYAFYKYTYGYSWVTNQGETAITPVVFLPDDPEKDEASRRIDMETPPASVVSVRLWRSLGEIHTITLTGAGTAGVDGVYTRTSQTRWDQVAGTNYLEFDGGFWVCFDVGAVDLYACIDVDFPIGPWVQLAGTLPVPTVTITYDADAVESAMFLLAEFPVIETTYFDTEGRDEFEARYESSVSAPTVNTTSAAPGEFGYFSYVPCCYYSIAPTGVGGPLVPVMTSNTEPSGIVTSGTVITGEPNFWWAFKNDTPTGDPETWIGENDLVTGVVNPSTEWVSYQFTDGAKRATAYSFNSHLSIGEQEGPTAWYLEGSNDGLAWTLLDTRAGVGGWVYAVDKTFNIANPGEYEYYRISFTEAATFLEPDSGFTISGLQFYGAVDVTTFVNNCPPCDLTVPGAQSADASPLPDIENVTPPGLFTSTKTVCTSCPAGFTNGPTTNLVPLMTSATAPSGTVISSTGAAAGFEAWKVFDRDALTYMDLVGVVAGYVGYHLTTAAIATSYALTARLDYTLSAPKAWTFEGSNNGTTWTVLDAQTNVGWFGGQVRSYGITNTTAYAYYRINITANVSGNPSSNLSLAGMELFGTVAATACASATRTSTVSQHDADTLATAAATAAAQALLSCVPIYTSTRSFTAQCAFGTFGPSVTKSATRTSLNSQAEADTLAQAAAEAAANAELVCTFSNNGDGIEITDVSNAVPYPSVQYFADSAIVAGITVAISGLTHATPDDLRLLLVSPGGIGVWLMKDCGGTNALSNVNLVFDDAGGALPDATQITSGTYEPTIFGGNQLPPAPAPQVLPSLTLAAFIGAQKQGAWKLFVSDDLIINAGEIISWSVTIT